MGRNYLKGRDGDRINAVLAAAGYNFTLLLRWLARLLRALFQALFTAVADAQPALNPPHDVLHNRLIYKRSSRWRTRGCLANCASALRKSRN